MVKMKTFITLVALSFIGIGCSSTSETIVITPKIAYNYSGVLVTTTILSKEQMNIQEKAGCGAETCHTGF